jgi:hypothetical protein
MKSNGWGHWPLVGLLVASFGCATVAEVQKADKAPDAGFVQEPEKLAPEPERVPFHEVWVQPGFESISFGEILVAPVDATHLLDSNLWEEANLRQADVDEDVRNLTVEMHQVVEDAFRNDPERGKMLVSAPGSETLVLELALVEVIPNKAWLGTVGLVAWGAPLLVGIPVATAASMLEHGSLAMEGRVRDGGTGEIVVEFKDREIGKTRILDVQGATWYGHAHEIIQDWSTQMVELANTPPTHRVEDSPWFTLKPW